MLQKRRQTLDVSQALGSYYIKYDRLFEINNIIFQSVFDNNINTSEIDVYIDLKNLLSKLYAADVFSNKRFSICAAIINLAAHIRGYYKKHHRLWARIFLVYGEDSSFNHRQFYQNFGMQELSPQENLKHQETDKFIHSQLELVKILCAYINELYFVHRVTDFSMFTYGNILNNPDRLSIVITKSKYVFQVPIFAKNCFLIRPSKVYNQNSGLMEDNSYLVYKNNALSMAYKKHNLEKIIKINPELMSLVWTLNGLPEKNVHQLVNITRATKMILDPIESNRLLNQYMSYSDLIYQNLLNIHTLIDSNSFAYRFYAIDLLYQYMIYDSQVESKDMTWKIDLRDPATIQNINTQYFLDNSLDLMNL